ncbi:hypothetical protein GCM10009616_14480 [Microlunatus lacustris]
MDALPPRSRLLHVGLMKTGTTALQTAASHRRQELLEHGVRYPGAHYNHRREVQALFGRSAATRAERPDYWDRLVAEVDGDSTRRILISNEMIAGGDHTVARGLRDDLGPLTHVVFTVRSFSSVLPSLWQQYVKSGHQQDFEEFLDRRLVSDLPPPPDMARHDQAALVTRWVDVFGPENVTVIVVDKTEPRRVPRSFEALLALPPGMLFEPELRGESLNRSLSVHEASLLLTVNRLLAPYDLPRGEVNRLLLKGATARVLDECPAPGPDAQLVLPPWAVELATARSQEHAEAIAASGARVVGDLAELSRPPRTDQGQWQVSTTVPVEVAAQAVVGALSAAMLPRNEPEQVTAGEARPVGTGISRARLLPAAVRRQLRRLRPRSGERTHRER